MTAGTKHFPIYPPRGHSGRESRSHRKGEAGSVFIVDQVDDILPVPTNFAHLQERCVRAASAVVQPHKAHDVTASLERD